jgi:putative glutamine amidotransferase
MNKRAPLIGISTDVEVRPETRPPRPFYMLDETNARALIASGATPVLLPPEPECVEAYLELCDGLIVSGGGYQFQVPQLFRHDGTEPPEKERRFRFEAALLRGAMARNLPVLAECGGFQVLNHVTGGELVVSLAQAREDWARHLGEGPRVEVHAVHVQPGTQLERIVGVAAFPTNSLHRQGVVKAGPGAVVSGLTDDGIVEAIEVPGQRFCIGTQWHPEFLNCEPERRLFEAFVRACHEGR